MASPVVKKPPSQLEIPPPEEHIVTEVEKTCQAIFAYTNRLWLIRAHLNQDDARFKSLNEQQTWKYRICTRFPCPHKSSDHCNYPGTSFVDECYLLPLCENVRAFAEKILKAETEIPEPFKKQLETLTTVLSYENAPDTFSLTNAKELYAYSMERRPRLLLDWLALKKEFSQLYHSEPSELTPEEASAAPSSRPRLKVPMPNTPPKPYGSSFDYSS